MEVTANGWIDYHDEEFDEVQEPFYDEKIDKYITDSMEAFQYSFPTGDEPRGKDVPEYVDEACKEEAGISFSRRAKFINALGSTFQKIEPL